jgi:glycosyltransferase involved in cell wall biosynthesis
LKQIPREIGNAEHSKLACLQAISWAERQTLTEPLRKIAVDLTPLLPGAENGGAKILALELVRRLASIAPETQFLILTLPRCHDELVALEAKNVSRKMIGNGEWQNRAWQWGGRLHRALVRRIPDRLRPVRSIVYELQRITAKAGRKASFTGELNVDLLFCPFGAGAGHARLPPGIPVVAIVVDLQHKAYPQFFTRDQITERDHNLNSHRTSFVAVISDFVKQSLLDEGFPEASVKTIYIRMDRHLPELTREHASSILQQLRLAPESYFLYPANFWRHKNHEMLFTAFLQARSRGLSSQIKLVCTGAPGPRIEELKDVIQRLGLDGAVIFPGFLDEINFSALMRSCLGVVFPSLYEGFGMPVLEAMAAGCPVACSDRTGLVEIVGNAALLFDPRNPSDIATAMCRLSSDGKLRADLINKGKHRAADFADSDRMAREYLELFQYAAGQYGEGDCV